MASLFGALGSLAESYGLARQNVLSERQQEARTRQEDERVKLEEEQIRQEGVRTQLEQARLKQELDLANRPMFLGSPYTRGGKQYIRTWDQNAVNPQGGRGKISEMELGAEGESEAQKFVNDFQLLFKRPPTEEQVMEAVYKVKPSTATAEQSADDLAYAWHYYGTKPAAKDLPRATEAMRRHKWGPGRPLTGMEGRTVETTKEAEGFTRELMKYLEDNNLTTSNNWLMGPYSVLDRKLVAEGYLHGHAPTDPVSGRLTRMSAAIKILGAQPYMQVGRGLQLFKEIGQHLPGLQDTPANMYQKAGQLLNIYNAIKNDVSTVGAEGFDPLAGEFGTSGGAAPETAPPLTSAPTTTIPPAGRTPRVVIHPDGSIEVK